ncbi:hypothetical protein [Nocardia sp. alder85J]|uniref:hypothetical protein n=1 Tax=Nocardia sp. alder85J TaxID=2862949 RepID=UPI001CD742F6|nr:hypothetical protein [Nocardia sp. alder85J]MCX4096990.1 hypothetical protein [Nocardia sp. alder85J]
MPFALYTRIPEVGLTAGAATAGELAVVLGRLGPALLGAAACDVVAVGPAGDPPDEHPPATTATGMQTAPTIHCRFPFEPVTAPSR